MFEGCICMDIFFSSCTYAAIILILVSENSRNWAVYYWGFYFTKWRNCGCLEITRIVFVQCHRVYFWFHRHSSNFQCYFWKHTLCSFKCSHSEQPWVKQYPYVIIFPGFYLHAFVAASRRNSHLEFFCFMRLKLYCILTVHE